MGRVPCRVKDVPGVRVVPGQGSRVLRKAKGQPLHMVRPT